IRCCKFTASRIWKDRESRITDRASRTGQWKCTREAIQESVALGEYARLFVLECSVTSDFAWDHIGGRVGRNGTAQCAGGRIPPRPTPRPNTFGQINRPIRRQNPKRVVSGSERPGKKPGLHGGKFLNHDGLQSKAGCATSTLCLRRHVFSLAGYFAVWLDRRADLFRAFGLSYDRYPYAG